MSAVQITDHFALHEFDQPAGHGIPAAPYPTEWIEERLRLLCAALEILRAELGDRPVTVISGYRSPPYNRAIGGARHSQHMAGRAADIVVAGVEAGRVHDTALRLNREGRLLIGGLGRYAGFTHLDVRPGATLARWRGARTARETRA
jgi:uncharacterized protein YcbK (DUF882 family)